MSNYSFNQVGSLVSTKSNRLIWHMDHLVRWNICKTMSFYHHLGVSILVGAEPAHLLFVSSNFCPGDGLSREGY